MVEEGFNKGRASPCVFYHKEKNVRVVIHGDYITILDKEGDLDWFKERIALKCNLFVGSQPGGGVIVCWGRLLFRSMGYMFKHGSRRGTLIQVQDGGGNPWIPWVPWIHWNYNGIQ